MTILYEVAVLDIIRNPETNWVVEKKFSKTALQILGGNPILFMFARSTEEAKMKIAAQLGKDYDPETMEIAVRPFGTA